MFKKSFGTMRLSPVAIALVLMTSACASETVTTIDTADGGGESLLGKYTTVRLSADLSDLSERQRAMIPLLIDAAKEMDAMFWIEAYGDPDSILAAVDDPSLRRFVEINYGPWDRIDGNSPFISGVGPKPAGANFYPADMDASEFESAAEINPALRSLYTMVRRDQAGELVAIPYHEFFSERIHRASAKLREAAALAESADLRRYLELRADALLDDEYRESDLAWMDMKDNAIDVVIGPIETYEDKLFGIKAAHEAFVLIKDREWSERLSHYAALLPSLQQGLPVSDAYKQESPGTDSDLNAYDAIYYAGDSNAGSKTIAINLPNDEYVQLQKGTRRLQLKNTMRAKFDEILIPISELLIDAEQRGHINFDAFFGNVMFHEVAHGLGVKNVLDGSGTVREALRERFSAMEEGKADVLGLYMVKSLIERGELDADLHDHYVTFLAGMIRSVRFGSSSAHGQANMIQFNFFKEQGAFERDDETGTYAVNFDRMEDAVDQLSERIIRFQGDGDYDAVNAFMLEYAQVDPQLEQDIERLGRAAIPVDIVFEQGLDVLQ